MALIWRPLSVADTDEWVRLHAAVEAVDRTGEHIAAEGFTELVADVGVDLRHGSLAVFDGTVLVAYGWVRTRPAAVGRHRVALAGAVHPGYRRAGLGRAVLAELIRLAERRHAATLPGLPLDFGVGGQDGNAGQRALLEQAGFRPVRWFYEMYADLTEPPPDLPLPDGLRLTEYRRELDEPLRTALNDCFAEHWGHVDETEESWRLQFAESHSLRPELCQLLLADTGSGTEVAAFVLGRHYPADTEASGVREVLLSDVATRKALRGRGIATALLAHTLSRARSIGYARAHLEVDSANPTGALGVYRRCGFEVAQRWTAWTLRAEQPVPET